MPSVPALEGIYLEQPAMLQTECLQNIRRSTQCWLCKQKLEACEHFMVLCALDTQTTTCGSQSRLKKKKSVPRRALPDLRMQRATILLSARSSCFAGWHAFCTVHRHFFSFYSHSHGRKACTFIHAYILVTRLVWPQTYVTHCRNRKT